MIYLDEMETEEQTGLGSTISLRARSKTSFSTPVLYAIRSSKIVPSEWRFIEVPPSLYCDVAEPLSALKPTSIRDHFGELWLPWTSVINTRACHWQKCRFNSRFWTSGRVEDSLLHGLQEDTTLIHWISQIPNVENLCLKYSCPSFPAF